ncbi:MAG: cytochrome c biogenesis CcdA family protein [Longimicrobiales bacterium]
MTLELAAVPLALLAGVAGVLSPCVWPLVPVVTSSAAVGGRSGPYWLAGGLSLSFAVAGTLLTLLLVSTGMDPEFFRYVSAVLLIAVALVLVIPPLGQRANLALSSLSARLPVGGPASGGGADGRAAGAGQFGVGALLGLVWLPCVGPTLGAAIALASMGQDLALGFLVMLAYGIGTAGVLLLAGLASGRLLREWSGGAARTAKIGKQILGWSLLVLAVLVLTGVDRVLEAAAVGIVPDWVFSF